MFDYILVRDEKAANVNGGDFTQGAWRTRDLNIEVSDTGSHATLSVNRITLVAGTYIVRAKTPAYLVGAHYCRVRDITNNLNLALGTSESSNSNNAISSWAFGKFILTGSAQIELQHYCATTKTVDGFGRAVNADVTRVEVYSILELIRLA